MSERTMYERVEERNGFKFVRLKSGRLLGFWDAHKEAERAYTMLSTAISRMFKLRTKYDDPDIADYDLERIEWFVDDLESYLGALRAEIKRLRGVLGQEERIALLRNTAGRTPEEAEAFRKKADELEQRLEKR